MVLRVVLYLVAAVVILAAIVIGVGYSLPQDHVATGSISLGAPPPAVFATLTDVSRYPAWRTDVSSVEVESTSPLRWRETAGGDTLTMEVVEIRPPDRLRVKIADPTLPFGGTWTYELAAEGAGTRVTITENGEVYNPVFRFVSRYVLGHAATIDRFLAALRARHP